MLTSTSPAAPTFLTSLHPASRQLVIPEAPSCGVLDTKWGGRVWPASWIRLAGLPEKPFDVVYRLNVELEKPQTVRLHVSADERYELRMDGLRVGRGPQRGDFARWSFETYEMELTAGPHQLWVWVSSLGQMNGLAPGAQLSRAHGLLVMAELNQSSAASWNTGTAAWQARQVTGMTYRPANHHHGHYAGGTQHVDARAFDWSVFDIGPGAQWRLVESFEDARDEGSVFGELTSTRPMRPSALPAMMERVITTLPVVRFAGPTIQPIDDKLHEPAVAQEFTVMLRGQGSMLIPPGSQIQIILDLEDYFCAYPKLRVTGGRSAEITVRWAEALYSDPDAGRCRKGNRDRVNGLYFSGKGDTWVTDGGLRDFSTVWWRCGRYVQITVKTGEQELAIDGMAFDETRYPLEPAELPEVSDKRLTAALALMQRSVLVSTHETFTDSPYYEQLQYVGDSRLEALVLLCRSCDAAMAKQCVSMFGGSLTTQGLTQSRYPSAVPQVIPGFCLWWMAMLHDFAMWRDGAVLVREQLPRVRGVLEVFFAAINRDGLLGPMPGWAFVDWVPRWKEGIPPGGTDRPMGVMNWHLVYTLRRMSELERWVGDDLVADRYDAIADRLVGRIEAAFYVPGKGLYRDDVHANSYGEHAQCLAVLSGALEPERCQSVMQAMQSASGLDETTIYFSHYKLAALAAVGDGVGMLKAMKLWRGLPEQGFVTTPEQPEPTRSDCHGWGGHPLYHIVCSVVGVQPEDFGFKRVRVRPCMGELEFARACVPHPAGLIHVSCQQRRGRLSVSAQLPGFLEGTLEIGRQRIPLQPGANKHDVSVAKASATM